MRGIPEFYPSKQGRPKTRSTNQVLVSSTIVSIVEEQVQIKDILDKLLNEMIQQQEKILIELQQMRLHLASLSKDDIDEEDVDG